MTVSDRSRASDARCAPLAMPIVASAHGGPLVGRRPMTAGTRDILVVAAARLLADWRAELGYLQFADAVQMLTDALVIGLSTRPHRVMAAIAATPRRLANPGAGDGVDRSG